MKKLTIECDFSDVL